MSPTGVEADRAAGTLTITWDDGHRSDYVLAAIRWACPCAECHGEWGRPGRLSHLDSLPADETRLETLLPVGTYAMTPVWASGHQSGIFSWEYLRALCDCDDCTAARRR
ncbi:MAG: DUF971 domain-containing protein [Chloroflexota bacterium]